MSTPVAGVKEAFGASSSAPVSLPPVARPDPTFTRRALFGATGDRRIRAGLPRTWRVADKTSAPLVVAALT